MKLKFAVLALVLTLFVMIYGSYIRMFNVNIRSEEPRMLESTQHFYDYSGSTHIHSKLSRGSLDYSGIIDEAKLANLNFIYFTDFKLPLPENDMTGYRDDLLVLKAIEYPYLDAEILNYHAQEESILQSPAQAQLYLSDLLTKTKKDAKFGLFILSHPTKPNQTWEGPLPVGINGIELYNLKSIWQKNWINHTGNFIWSLFLYPINPNLSLLRLFNVPNENLSLWNKHIKNQKLIGIVGSDAEANIRIGKNNRFSFPSYATVFSIAKNHILLKSELTGQFDTDQQKIQQAINNGQFYLSLDILGDPNGFETYIVDSKSEIHPIGVSLKQKHAQELIVHIPFKMTFEFKVNIFKNGEKMMTSNSNKTSFKINEPGAYNVIVSVKVPMPFPEDAKWFDWIFTNAFYVN